jgi:micrococcal nuclease
MPVNVPPVPSTTSLAETPTSTVSQDISTGTTSSGHDFFPQDASATAYGRVVEVIDGDTLVVLVHKGEGQLEDVRLIGIDAPEKGEDFAGEATAALEDLVDQQEVRLETGAEERDQYGRLLAYVFVGDGVDELKTNVFVNAELLRRGLATLYTVPPNVRYVDRLQQAQDQARTARVGMWAAAAASPLKIADVVYDPPGDDTLDLNQEYLVFEVMASGSLKGYAVEDESGHRFDFPDTVYQEGQTLTLHSGRGTNTQSDLYWGASGSAIWNNNGDLVKVLDPQGRIVESYQYGGGQG